LRSHASKISAVLSEIPELRQLDVSLRLWDGVESFDANVGVVGTIGEETVIHALTERRLQAQWCDSCSKFDINIDRRSSASSHLPIPTNLFLFNYRQFAR
jgi:hypothetical protein